MICQLAACFVGAANKKEKDFSRREKAFSSEKLAAVAVAAANPPHTHSVAMFGLTDT